MESKKVNKKLIIICCSILVLIVLIMGVIWNKTHVEIVTPTEQTFSVKSSFLFQNPMDNFTKV